MHSQGNNRVYNETVMANVEIPLHVSSSSLRSKEGEGERRKSEREMMTSPSSASPPPSTSCCFWTYFYNNKKQRMCAALITSLLTLLLIMIYGIASLTKQTFNDEEFRESVINALIAQFERVMPVHKTFECPTSSPSPPFDKNTTSHVPKCGFWLNDWSNLSRFLRQEEGEDLYFEPFFLSAMETKWVQTYRPRLKLNNRRTLRIVSPWKEIPICQNNHNNETWIPHRLAWSLPPQSINHLKDDAGKKTEGRNEKGGREKEGVGAMHNFKTPEYDDDAG